MNWNDVSIWKGYMCTPWNMRAINVQKLKWEGARKIPACYSYTVKPAIYGHF